MTLGAIAVGNVNMEFLHKLDFLFLNDFKSRIESSWTEIFITSFVSAFIFALILEFTALSFWGVAIIPLIILIKSFGIGISAGYLYFIYGLKGIAFYTLILLPGIFISLIGFIFISCSAMDISYKFLKNIFLNFLSNKNIAYNSSKVALKINLLSKDDLTNKNL